MPNIDNLDLQAKEEIKVTSLPSGIRIKRAKQRSILDLHGLLYSQNRKPIPLNHIISWK
jgi:hypothetical protein